MARRWRVSAKSMSGKAIEVYVSQKDWSGDVVAVEAAADMIEWADDDDRDVLVPVRGQSGYLRVVDDGSGEVEQMMPRNNMEHYVEVLRDGVLVWQGYMQAATYTAAWDIAPKVVEFPLIDGLTALESVYMDGTKEMRLTTLGELVHEALTATGVDVQSVVYPKEVRVSESDAAGYAAPWLMEVSRFNFFEKSNAENYDDPEYQRYDGITYKELLEEVCKLWGWRLVMRGSEALFLSTEADGYVRMALAGLKNAGTATTEEVAVASQELAGLDWMSTDHTIERLQGCNKVAVTAETKEIPTETAPMIDELETYEDVGTLGDRERGLLENLIVREAGDGRTMEAMLYSEWGTKLENWDNAAAIETTKGAVFADEHVGERAGRDDAAVEWNYSQVIRMYLRRTNAEALPTEAQSGESPVMRLTVPEGVIYGGRGALVISGKVRGLKYEQSGDSYIISETNGRCYLPIEVEIGGKWYVSGRDESWSGTKSVLRVRCGDQDDAAKEDGDGKIVNTMTRSSMYKGADGYVIPLRSDVRGVMRVNIYAPWEVGRSDVIVIEDFKVAYAPMATKAKETSGNNHFRAVLQNGFKQEKEVKLMTGTRGRGVPSYSYMTYGGGDVNKLLFTDGAMRPEEALLGKLKKSYGRIVEALTVDVADDERTGQLMRLQHGGKVYVVLAEAVEPLEERKRVTMIEI